MENSRKYWEKREFPGNIGKNANVLKTKVPQVNWNYTREKIKFKQSNVLGGKNIEKKLSLSSMSTYHFQKFLNDFLFPYISESLSTSITQKTVSLSDNTEAIVLKPIVLVCNFDTVKDMMNMTKKKYKKSDVRIERGSLWEFELNIKPVMQGGRMKTGFEFVHFSKKFPN